VAAVSALTILVSADIGTAITEGTATFLVNRRMNKSQQMRWSPREADLLLQLRCAVHNGTLGPGFGQRSILPTIRSCKQRLQAHPPIFRQSLA
jgi:hypothetical protein